MKLMMRLTAVSLAAVLLLCGCGDNAPSADPAVDYSAMVEAPVDLKITDCISEQQISTVMGTSMILQGLYEENTQAYYMAEDGTAVNINLKNQERGLFDAAIADFGTNATLFEGVGETAFLVVMTEPDSSEIISKELLVYINDYTLGVSVVCADITMEETYIRQIAEIMVDALQSR